MKWPHASLLIPTYAANAASQIRKQLNEQGHFNVLPRTNQRQSYNNIRYKTLGALKTNKKQNTKTKSSL
jgi:mRNA degradation ribonuclease J1/J2